MTKRLWSFSIVCLLVTSCGVPYSKPFQDQSSTQHSHPDVTQTSTEANRDFVESQLVTDAAGSKKRISMLSPTSTPSASALPTATQAPSHTLTPILR